MDLGGAASLDELENRLRTGLDRAAAEVWSGCEMLLVRLRLQGRTELDGLLRKGTTCAELADRFLFLAAQYESWTVPIAVLLSLPVAALGAYLGVWVCGLENDVYFQIGLVMLVGLAAKNAILIVEFAKVQVDKGEDLVQSAIYAAKLRFRPILMTSLAFVLGMLPMVLASGPGSASRQAIGTGVFFGMIFAIVFGIILVPFFFVMVYKTKSKILKHKK